MSTSKYRRRYGWKKDRLDHRDFRYLLPDLHLVATLPPRVDLRPNMPPVWDQGELGSCTAHAIGAAFAFEARKQATAYAAMTPSRLFLYFNERDMEGTTTDDAGAEIRDGVKSTATTGLCDETLWPYDPARFADKPTPDAYADALDHRTTTYLRVAQTLPALQSCLASGFPIAFGISVFDSFEGDGPAATGVVPMPSTSESNLGGHAILLCGYDTYTRQFTFRNSWGDGWGAAGYGYLPFDYVQNPDLASDFWTIRQLTT